MVKKDIKILLVEDDPALLAGLLLNLQVDGYKVTAAPQGNLALNQLKSESFDLMILDLMLPDIDGLSIINEMHKLNINTPTLILSALSDTDTKVKGLMAGADDYLTKPFELEELLARVSVLLRRKKGSQNVVRFGNTEVFSEERKITYDGKIVHLTPKEYDLLIWFINNPNKVFSREVLLDNIWHSSGDATTRTVDNFVMTLRKKLDNPRRPKFFITVRGHGYRFDN